MKGKTLETKYTPPRVYAAETGTDLGRGVFAADAFQKGEVIEIAPIVPLNANYQDLPLELRRVVFNWSKLKGSSAKFALAAGFGSLYNHSDTPNTRYSGNAVEGFLKITALRDIKPGEQLTVSYNQAPNGVEPRKKSWFDTNGVEQIDI
jgi:SET domain-containing protein